MKNHIVSRYKINEVNKLLHILATTRVLPKHLGKKDVAILKKFFGKNWVKQLGLTCKVVNPVGSKKVPIGFKLRSIEEALR